ncbi:MAG: FKBP-type peptidyl-prolyl cis-trans isomerase [Bacteroidota bacterium]|nr:FKBP-type peptidyl-prolyl cis-trans isomerase [Bacteroidota bacterium]MDX5431905.1 FKBP-type peptidyl-prolyl cis-trans isomerase [Bacteroidota bacterium]MDX5470619.1 FKBP-type peptidyl-prolyl cis-trans isomerase [Bacteroidota bacterium]
MTTTDTITTASGLKVVFKSRGDGQQAKAGDVVSVHYVGTLLNGTEFDNSVKRGEPIQFPLGQGYVIKGWDEGIAMMRVGDKATLVIPPAIGYGDRDMGTIPPNSTLVFEVELVAVKEVKQPVPFDTEGKKIEKTPSGLQYIMIEENPDGEQAYANMNVEVDYTLYLEDGTIVDSSIPRGEPFKFVLGAGQVISGWDEGIRLMKVGDKMRMIVPAKLGYGDRGAGGVIPPGATLIFDVELISATR